MRRFPALNRYRFRVMQRPAIQRDASLLRASQTADGVLISEGFSPPGDAKDSRDPTGWQRFVEVKQCVPSVWEKVSSSMI